MLIGSFVFYHKRGIGQIINIENDYYKIKLDDGIIYIPINNNSNIRALASKTECKTALKIALEEITLPPFGSKWTTERKHYIEKLTNLTEIAEVIRDLRSRRGNGCNTINMLYLKAAKMFIDEVTKVIKIKETTLKKRLGI